MKKINFEKIGTNWLFKDWFYRWLINWKKLQLLIGVGSNSHAMCRMVPTSATHHFTNSESFMSCIFLEMHLIIVWGNRITFRYCRVLYFNGRWEENKWHVIFTFCTTLLTVSIYTARNFYFPYSLVISEYLRDT